MTEKQLLVLSKKNCDSKLIKIQTVGTSIKLVETKKKTLKTLNEGMKNIPKVSGLSDQHGDFVGPLLVSDHLL